MATTISGFYLLSSNARQAWLDYNDNLYRMESLSTIRGVIDKDRTDPTDAPALTPVDGDLFIVASPGAGVWAGQTNKLAQFKNGIWVFYTPMEGVTKWVNDENKFYTWTGAAWVSSDETWT